MRATRRSKRAGVPWQCLLSPEQCRGVGGWWGSELMFHYHLSSPPSLLLGLNAGPDVVQRDSVHLALEEDLRAFNKLLRMFD